MKQAQQEQATATAEPQVLGAEVPDGVKVAKTVDPRMVPYSDKRGRSREALAMVVDGDAIEFVSWENWELLGRVIARSANDPAFGMAVANAIRKGYLSHAGASNGSARGGVSLLG